MGRSDQPPSRIPLSQLITDKWKEKKSPDKLFSRVRNFPVVGDKLLVKPTLITTLLHTEQYPTPILFSRNPNFHSPLHLIFHSLSLSLQTHVSPGRGTAGRAHTTNKINGTHSADLNAAQSSPFVLSKWTQSRAPKNMIQIVCFVKAYWSDYHFGKKYNPKRSFRT